MLASIRTIDFTTIGRTSLEPRTVEIWWFHIDERFIVTGTPGARDWYANILHNPEVTVSTSFGDFAAKAVPIHDPDVRRGVFIDPSANWYSTQAELDELVELSPMVELELRFEQQR